MPKRKYDSDEDSSDEEYVPDSESSTRLLKRRKFKREYSKINIHLRSEEPSLYNIFS